MNDRDMRSLALEKVPPAMQARQVAFLHIMKTAGTSLHYWLRKAMPETPIFHGDEYLFDRTSAAELSNHGLLLGHFSWNHVAKFRRPYIITFLRDPVDRVTSVYWWLRNWDVPDPTVKEAAAIAKTTDLKGFLASDDIHVRRLTENQQAYALASDWRSPRTVSHQQLLHQATSNLAKVGFAGYAEDYGGCLRLLSRELSLANPPPAEHLNKTNKFSPTDEEREMIEALNSVDKALHDRVRRGYWRTDTSTLTRQMYGAA